MRSSSGHFSEVYLTAWGIVTPLIINSLASAINRSQKFGQVWALSYTSSWFIQHDAITHWGHVTHLCISKLTIIASDNALPVPSHYLSQKLWIIVIWTLGNKLQWNSNRNQFIFIQENAFENVVWKMVVILSRSQCVNGPSCTGFWLYHVCVSPHQLNHSMTLPRGQMAYYIMAVII